MGRKKKGRGGGGGWGSFPVRFSFNLLKQFAVYSNFNLCLSPRHTFAKLARIGCSGFEI